MEAILDAALIARRRVELGLSQRAVASAVGVGPPVVSAIERGRGHERLTLRLVARLAETLGLEPASLFAHAERTIREPAADDTRLEAVLAQNRKRLARDELACILGWDIERTSAGLEMLAQRLKATGQALHFNRSAGGYALRSRDGLLTEDEQRSTARVRHRRSGLTVRQAQLLAAVIDGKPGRGWTHAQSGADRANQGTLLALGLVELEDGVPRLTKAAAYSLGVRRRRPQP